MNIFKQHLQNELENIQSAGLFKKEGIITSPQNAHITINGKKNILNMCANNYLGLADHPEVIAAAQEALNSHGYGMASVRFICGTQNLHKTLEEKISNFYNTEDTILYPSCFDANTGLFETLLTQEDAIISDSLNHASIIDGIRLCKAARYRYDNNNMLDLEEKLQATKNARFKMIATDGVFSMDGIIANLPEIVNLAQKYQAITMIDECHAAGFLGKTGRGTPEYHHVQGKIDIITGTLGKALGGASGGYITGKKEIIELLRQRSRPYLFSNSVAPHIAAASIKALDIISKSTELRDKLEKNTEFFRKGIESAGLTTIPSSHPIVPIMLGEAKLAQEFAYKMLEKGVYCVGFFYPVVPQGKARIRTQVSAAHSLEDLDYAIKAFSEVNKELNLFK